MTREELFWRAKLSYLHYLDDLQRFRSALRGSGEPPGARAKDHVLDHFRRELQVLDQVFRESTSEQERADAFRLFDTAEGLAALREQGWLLVNHTAAHYPVAEAAGRALFAPSSASANRDCGSSSTARPSAGCCPSIVSGVGHRRRGPDAPMGRRPIPWSGGEPVQRSRGRSRRRTLPDRRAGLYRPRAGEDTG